jgi:uncharacterized delta-60 repeat protein
MEYAANLKDRPAGDEGHRRRHGHRLRGVGGTGFGTVRFTAAAGLDPTWNGGGIVRTQLGSSSNDRSQPHAIGQQVDGRLVSIGLHQDPDGTADIGLVRYSVEGGPGGVDFGSVGDGTSVVNLGGDEPTNDGVVLDSSLIARLTPNGLLDTSLAAPIGFNVIDRGTSSRADATTADAQGRILVAGTFASEDASDVVLLLRYNDDGSHDPSFGDDGEVVVSGPANERAVAVRGRRCRLPGDHGQRERSCFLPRAPLQRRGRSRLRVRGGGSRRAPRHRRRHARHGVLADGRVVMLGASGGQAFFVRFTRRGQVDPFFGTE